MTRSNETTTKTPNPATKFLEFKNGKFSYYDKTSEANVEVPLPLRFIVLDELATIKGWDSKTNSGIYSNEVHSTKATPLKVKSF